MSENLQRPQKRGGNRHTFPEDLYSDLGRMVLENPTANHRCMFSRPNITPLCAILLVILIPFIVCPIIDMIGFNINLQCDVSNYSYEIHNDRWVRFSQLI